MYHSEQLTLAQRGDVLTQSSRKLPVLHDVKSLRYWWLSGAVHYSMVQEILVPLLMGYHRHTKDNALRGAWARRAQASIDADERDRLCWRPALSRDLCWLVVRFAGHVVQEDESPIGIVNNQEEMTFLQTEVLGSEPQQIITRIFFRGVF